MPLFLLHRPGGRSTLLVRSSSKKRSSQEYQRYAEVDRQTSVASADAPPGRSHPLQNEWEDRSDVELRLHPDDAVLDSPALRNRLASVVLVLSIVQAGVRRPSATCAVEGFGPSIGLRGLTLYAVALCRALLPLLRDGWE